MIPLICLGAFITVLILYLRQVYSRFSKFGVEFINPVPILGNVGNVALQKCHLARNVQDLYNAFPNERFVGRFELMRPVVVIKDLELIRQVTVKDFEHFLDHRSMVDENVDPLFGRNLFSLKGQEWKDMRSTLSPAFTSSKIRAMVPFIVHVNKQMVRMLMNKIKESKSGYIDIDSKDLITRCTNDVIASCAFGVKIDSYTEPDNEFYLHGKSNSHFSFRRILVYLGYSSFPSLMKKLNMKFFSEEANDYFKDLFFNTILERKRNNILRPDMIHLLLEATKGNLRHEEKNDQNEGFATVDESEVGKKTVHRSWSDNDLIAQALIFFMAGFESVSSVTCFLFYELAINTEVQERLVNEIRENMMKKKSATFDYNFIQSLKYLDMVISEVLRLWPVGIGLDRVCVKDYNLGKPNDKVKTDYVLHKGEFILVPVWSIHRDPNYFPDPEKFDPERFSDKNKVNIKPFTYMPFGSGPRNCIGSRFALCELKVIACQVLLQFEVSPSEKTRIPLKLATDAFTLGMEGGHWIRFRLRA